jgi:hypothetical protein
VTYSIKIISISGLKYPFIYTVLSVSPSPVKLPGDNNQLFYTAYKVTYINLLLGNHLNHKAITMGSHNGIQQKVGQWQNTINKII